ncbi:MAG: hypothetical protein KC684_07815 [Candidatus Omnitrophica bacterium]|nr:hypothetical protein [Candidatus Omnitrophota bacterium]
MSKMKFNWAKAILFPAFIAVPIFMKAKATGKLNGEPIVIILILVVAFLVFGFLDSFLGDD